MNEYDKCIKCEAKATSFVVLIRGIRTHKRHGPYPYCRRHLESRVNPYLKQEGIEFKAYDSVGEALAILVHEL